MSIDRHVVVYHDPAHWAAVPANNGGNGPTWQWDDELLVGFNRGIFARTERGHQCSNAHPFESWLARSVDGGETWRAWQPDGYAGTGNSDPAQPIPDDLDPTAAGLVLRVEGAGYHGNHEARWFASYDSRAPTRTCTRDATTARST